MRAGARIAAGARRAVLDREGAEAAQFDAIAARERGGDLAEHGVHDILDVALIEVRVLPGDTLNELGFDHRSRRPLLTRGRLRDGHGAFLVPRRARARS